MGYNGQSVQTNNKKKVKLHKKKRAEVRNQRKVATITKGPRTVLRKPRPSKKKLQKDSKRRRIVIDAEKAKLLKSGLITQEDIDNMEADAKDNEDAEEDDETAEDMEN